MRALLTACLMLTAPMLRAEALIDNACLGNAYESCFILIEGEFEPGLTDRFIAMAEGEGFDGGVVYLSSPGGSLGEAIRLGRYIRSKGWDTTIGGTQGIPRHADGSPDFFGSEGPTPATCESACAYVFMAGAERNIEPGSRLGIHQFYAPGQQIAGEVAQKFSGELVAYMVEMGVDARIFTLASAQEKDGMYYVTQEEAEQFDLVTPYGYDAFFLEPYKAGLIAAAKRLDPPKPYDEVDQVSFFCRGGVPHALLHAQSAGLSGNDEGSPVFWTDNTEQRLPADAVTVRVTDAGTYLTVRMTPAQGQALAGAQTFAIGGSYGRVVGGDYTAAKRTTPMDRQMIAAAFRFCID